jgi:hypothetical protein
MSTTLTTWPRTHLLLKLFQYFISLRKLFKSYPSFVVGECHLYHYMQLFLTLVLQAPDKNHRPLTLLTLSNTMYYFRHNPLLLQEYLRKIFKKTIEI